ncbi:MAG: molybdopterin biosynthesis protein [Desulfobacterota bacterium]|nr:molybdopterin biosynthesis protein [Thermodesulfobacteriota bacterium]
MRRNIYLKKISLKEAREIALRMADLIRLEQETLPVTQASGRVTAEPIFAKVFSPPFHCAAMDGIAVRAESTYGASESLPRVLRVGQEAVFVNTGQPIPPGMNAVIMIEEVHQIGPDEVEIRQAAHPYQHVRSIGEDIIATEMVLPENHKITPYDLGALLASGHREIAVKRQPRVLILPTGSELVDPETLDLSRPLDKIIDSNSYVIAHLVREDGGKPIRSPIVEDDAEKIRQALLAKVEEVDLILILAGSSAGSEDYTRLLIETSGEVYAHGIAMMPGKPTLLGRFLHRPIVGIPGYPVSAIMAYEELVRPLLYRTLHLTEPKRIRIKAIPSRKIPSKLGTEELLRVNVGKIQERYIASPLPRGAGLLSSLTKADGILRIPPDSEGLEEQQEVEVELLRPLEEIHHTVVMVGSHDLTLDLLGRFLRQTYPPLFLSSHSVGSLGGILAIRDEICHFAGMHLLDPDTGEYNFPYLRKYLKKVDFKVINLVHREQGLILQRNNPKGIKGLADLVREDLTFVNRQKGSGTRILLDQELKKLSLDPARIRGYENEEYSHMTVASLVAHGRVDAGLGILSAAKAMGLDFIPIVRERYDLVIPASHLKDERVQKVIETIRSKRFKEEVLRLGGYDVSMTGEELLSP